MSRPNPAKEMDLAQFDGHTIGPWKWLPEGTLWVYIDGKNENVLWPLNVPGVRGDLTWAERLGACGINAEKNSETNARLIAAAPALLVELKACRAERDTIVEALRAFCNAWDEYGELENVAVNKAWADGMAALKKAVML